MRAIIKRISAVIMAVILVTCGSALKHVGAQPHGSANLMPTRDSLPAKPPIKYQIQDEKPPEDNPVQTQAPERELETSDANPSEEANGLPGITEYPVMDEMMDEAMDESQEDAQDTESAEPTEPMQSTEPTEAPATPLPEKIFKPEALLGDDGMFYVSLYRLLEDMGYTYGVSGEAEDRSLVVSWSDKNWGDYWVDMKTHYVHGPELLYQLSWIHLIEDEPYVPAQTIAEACFWAYSYDASVREATIERLSLTRFKIDKTMQLMYTYGADINGKEKLMRTSLTTTGNYFGSTPSRTYYPQSFRLNAQHKYYFPTAKVYIKYCSGLLGNICSHTPYTRSAYEIDTPEMARGYAALGSRGSDGCVRFSFEEAKFVHCLGQGIPFTVVDGENTEEAQAEKNRLKLRQPAYRDWIRQMKLYE